MQTDKITTLNEVSELGQRLRQEESMETIAIQTLESIFQDTFSATGAQACMLIGMGVLDKETVVRNLERLIEVIEAV